MNHRGTYPNFWFNTIEEETECIEKMYVNYVKEAFKSDGINPCNEKDYWFYEEPLSEFEIGDLFVSTIDLDFMKNTIIECSNDENIEAYINNMIRGKDRETAKYKIVTWLLGFEFE